MFKKYLTHKKAFMFFEHLFKIRENCCIFDVAKKILPILKSFSEN